MSMLIFYRKVLSFFVFQLVTIWLDRRLSFGAETEDEAMSSGSAGVLHLQTPL